MAYENLKSAIKQAIKQNGNQEITGNLLQSTLLSMADNMYEVVQSTGEAEDKVMSQKATSTELSKKVDKTYVDTELGKKFDKSSIVQTSGTSESAVMSQKAIATELENIPFESVRLQYDLSKQSELRHRVYEGWRFNYNYATTYNLDKTRIIKKLYIKNINGTTASVDIYNLETGKLANNKTTFSLKTESVNEFSVNIKLPPKCILAIGEANGIGSTVSGDNDFTEEIGNIYSYYLIGGSGKPQPGFIGYWFDLDINIKEYIDSLCQNTNSHTEKMPYIKDNFLQIFKKVICIGDSLTAGFTNVDNTLISSAVAKSEKLNYPGFLEKRTGNTWTNLAIGNSTSHHWRYSDGPSESSKPDINLANVHTDLYTIALGANDVRKSLQIGTAGDINYSNAENNADSFYGNYDYIVRKLHSFNNNASIILFTMSKIEGVNANSYNEAIRYISNKYSYCHLLDLWNIDDFNSSFLKNCWKSSHFTPVGYNRVSSLMEFYINKMIEDNVDAFIKVPYYNNYPN